MAILEQLGRMTYVDALGDQHILYPFTKKSCVEGLDSIEESIGEISELKTENKTNLVSAINEISNNGGSNIQESINRALESAKLSGDFDGRGIISVIRTGGNGAAGTVDTYTITYSDDTTSVFNVYNGANGVGDGSGNESGENGATFTPFVDAAGNLSWSNDKGLANPDTINIRGSDGYSPVKGVDYTDGADGYSPTVSTKEVANGYEITIVDKDSSQTIVVNNGQDGGKGDKGDNGVSCTHSWDGTVLNITSASGTSSVDLVGRTGESGVGIESVEQTTISEEDNGVNVITITLSNGESFTINIRNGSKGNTGDVGGRGETGPSGENATINGVTTLTLNTGNGISQTQTGNVMTISANYDYGTTDLSAGSSPLETGRLYYVYE